MTILQFGLMPCLTENNFFKNNNTKKYIWMFCIGNRDGNSTLVDEVKTQLNGEVPSCIVASVGGGGLLMGVLSGLKRAGINIT